MNTEKELLIAYRRFIGVFMIALVPSCILFGLIGHNWTNDYGMWYQSISAMYWTSSRNVFVGLIVSGSIFFLLYNGYNWMDKVVNILTGCCLLGLIFCPSYSDAVLYNNFQNSFELLPYLPIKVCDKIHNICAISIFVIQTLNLLFLFTKQNGEVTDKKKQRNIVYYSCAGIAVVLLLTNQLIVFLATHGVSGIKGTCIGLVIQFLAFTDLGVAWLVKGEGLAFLNDK